jgi:hypothetical protein
LKGYLALRLHASVHFCRYDRKVLGKDHKFDKIFTDWTDKNQNILAATYEGDVGNRILSKSLL